MSVEQQLGKLREQALNYPEGRRQLVAVQFYLQWIIGECQSEWNRSIKSHTTYRVLLGQIDRQLKGEPACLVTFNYDTLLEEAFLSLGRPFRTLDEYVSRSDYKIIKPHGSVNWTQELNEPTQTPTQAQLELFRLSQLRCANDLIARAEKLRTIDKYHLITNSDLGAGSRWVVSQIDVESGLGAVLPAIAIPLEKKQDYICPASHLEVLRDCISKADKLLIIGWKGAEEKFSQLLSEGLKKEIPKMVVSSGRVSAEKIVLALFGPDGPIDCHLGEGGFANEIRSGTIEAFIKK
jgi:hypothetical protein